MPARFDLVSFVTDYGSLGGFVGAMHAVVDQIGAGELKVIDIDHHVPRHDILLGAVRLERSMPYLRHGVHVAVVDPGVGSSRRDLALEVGGRVLVGPDNGVLSLAAESLGGVERAFGLSGSFFAAKARTFDGRDVYAPAAAHIALGRDLSELGEELPASSLQSLERPLPHRHGAGYELLVLQVDGFGNVQFAAPGNLLAGLCTRARLNRLGEGPAESRQGVVATVGSTFADVASGSPVLLSDSDECLALSVNLGRADELLGVSPGEEVALTPSD